MTIDLVHPDTGELLDADSIPGLAEIAAMHDQKIAALAEALAELIDKPPPGSVLRRPIVWAQLAPHDADHLWQQLGTWVGWLRGRYPLARKVPPCWWRHPELVEEITALWLAWREAYTEKDAPLSAGADWHGRWLPEFLRRIGTGGWNVACETSHRPLVAGQYGDCAVDDADAFAIATAGTQAQTAGSEANSEAVDSHPPTVASRQETSMDHATMRQLLDTGRATYLGGLPGSPVAVDEDFYAPLDHAWTLIEEPETVAYLHQVRRRLALADEAVAAQERAREQALNDGPDDAEAHRGGETT